MTNEITLTDVINQMQVHAGEFRKEFRKVRTRIDDLDKKLSHKIDTVDKRLSRRMDGIDQKLLWQSTALTNIDGRLDDIELEFLPKRVDRIEKKMQLPS